MPNEILTPSVIAKEALVLLENKLGMAKRVHRNYQNEFSKVGDTVTIRKPVRFTTRSGATYSAQDVQEGSTTVTMTDQIGVDFEFQTADLTLKIEQFSERYLAPAMSAMIHKVEGDLCGLYNAVWNSVGIPGTTPNSFAALAAAPLRLDLMAVPTDMRMGVLDPNAGWSILGTQTTLYMQGKAQEAYEDGELGSIAGLNLMQTQNVKAHTIGTKAGTPLIAGASQNTTYTLTRATNSQSLLTDGWTFSSAILKKGDVFTIANVFAVNPVTKQVTTVLQQFVVNADISADGAGLATLNISPAIITTGAYQNVNAAPADNAAITVLGTASTAYPQNLVYHKNAFALVTRPLEIPQGASWSARETYNGLSMRIISDYDISTDRQKTRLDMLYGVKAIYPDLACRLFG
jgi:hypothetical protein